MLGRAGGHDFEDGDGAQVDEGEVAKGRHRDLSAATVLGARWIALSRVCADGAVIIASIPLARLLSPAKFGQSAVALVVIGLASVIGPGGMTAPVVQRGELRREEIGAAQLLSLAGGVVFTVFTLILGLWVLPGILGSDTADLVALSAPAWLLCSVGAVPAALLQRDLRFKAVAGIDAISVVLGTVVALSGAIVWRSPIALIVGGLATAGAVSFLSVAAGGWCSCRTTRRGYLGVAGFALVQTTSGLTWALFRNIDYIILSARMSSGQVGLYWRAYQLAVLQPGKVSQVMQKVAFPVYSRTLTHAEVLRLRMRITRLHAIVLVPLLGCIAATAPIAVPTMFGPEWHGAVVPLQIMALAAACEALVTGSGPLLTAMGRAGVLLAANAVAAAVYAATIIVLAPFGLVAVAWGVAAFSVADLILMQLVLIGPLAKVPLRQFVREAFPGVSTGFVLFAGLSGIRLLFMGRPSGLALAALVIASGVLYVAMFRLIFTSAWNDLGAIWRRATAPAEVANR